MSRPDGVTLLAIPDAGPLFEGHFPGRPILPGILLLHLALREAPLAGIEMLRFRRLVLPGERLASYLALQDELAHLARQQDQRAQLEQKRRGRIGAKALRESLRAKNR